MEDDTINENESAENRVTKRSRSGSGRESTAREIDERAPLAFGHMSRFHLPESILADKRYEFGWSAYMVRGEEFHQSYNNAKHKGWENLPPSEYSVLNKKYKNDPFRSREVENDSYYESGQIAMRRRVEDKKKEDQHWASIRRSNQESINQFKNNRQPLMVNGNFIR